MDRKSCPIHSIDTLGRIRPAATQAKSRDVLTQPGILVLLAIGFLLCVWSCFVSLKAYDLQAISPEKAQTVRIGMTHQQVIDIMGRDAVPIPAWNGFEKAADHTIRQISETAEAAMKTRRVSACSPDRDAACGAHYTLKDGSGLRIIYSRGVVIYAGVGYGYGRRLGR